MVLCIFFSIPSQNNNPISYTKALLITPSEALHPLGEKEKSVAMPLTLVLIP